MRPLYKYPAIAGAVLIVFILSLAVIIPDGLVEEVVRGALEENARISFSAKDFKKAFPLGFKARGVRLSNQRGKGGNGSTGPVEIAEMEELNVSLVLLPLLAGTKKLSYSGRLGNGTIEGEAVIEEAAQISVNAKDVALNAALPLKAMGIKGGSVSGEAVFTFFDGNCPKGKAGLDATGVDVGGLRSPWPALLFGERVSASLEMEMTAGCKVFIKGLFIEGRSLNARLEGSVRIKNPVERSALDMKIEIFVKPGSTEMNALLSLIKEHKRSSGYYSFNLKGTIGKPVIKKRALQKGAKSI